MKMNTYLLLICLLLPGTMVLAAEGQGFKSNNIQGFVEMVPMANAEIVRLQQEEHHAYMQ